jgi:3-carboxy-cis,cis-muconate cycloisomerase
MPHKRNPVGASAAIACAGMAPHLAAMILAAEVQEHERSAGAWAVEWPAFPALLLVVSGALSAIVDIAEGLEIDPERMRANLSLTHGRIMAEAVSMRLAEKMGKQDAHRLVEEASKKAMAGKRALKDLLSEDKRVAAQLAPAELEKLFEPTNYQGVAQLLIDRQLAAARKAISE